MTKLPTIVRIGPYDYDVVLVQRIQAYHNEGIWDRWGEVDYPSSTIRIGKYCSISQRWETLFHEVMHVISNNMPSGEELSEDQVKLLAVHLVDFLRDNKLLEIEPLTPEEEQGRSNALTALRTDNERHIH